MCFANIDRDADGAAAAHSLLNECSKESVRWRDSCNGAGPPRPLCDWSSRRTRCTVDYAYDNCSDEQNNHHDTGTTTEIVIAHKCASVGNTTQKIPLLTRMQQKCISNHNSKFHHNNTQHIHTTQNIPCCLFVFLL